MDTSQSVERKDRPYRSHLQPACLSCRRRKSRCRLDEGAAVCYMCHVHGSECVFPEATKSSTPRRKRARITKTSELQGQITMEDSGHTPAIGEGIGMTPVPGPPSDFSQRVQASAFWDHGLQQQQQHHAIYSSGYVPTDAPVPEPVSNQAEDAEQSAHIVGPATTNDAQVLGGYMSGLPQGSTGSSPTWSFPNTMSFRDVRKPVVFAPIRKQPEGMKLTQTQGMYQCQVIEKLVDPYGQDLIDLYFDKANPCFPLFDETSFKARYRERRQQIPPALLSCLLANSLTYWQRSNIPNRCPDVRFVWVQAIEALSTALLLSPDIWTVISVLLNVGGRPTTSMTGNAMTLASAIALSYSLGLNRDPSRWDIADTEKSLRIRVWWCVLIHDRWCSFAYGTPPHIQNSHYDVPCPSGHDLVGVCLSPSAQAAMEIFIALCSLTSVLEDCLRQVYDVADEALPNDAHEKRLRGLELRLDQWQEHLPDLVQRIASRGNSLNEPGAANLRLCYLSVRLLLRRIDLDMRSRSATEPDPDVALHRRLRAQRAAEDIVHFIQELTPPQLDDFWLSSTAFILASTTTLLLRCALESQSDTTSAVQTTAMKRAQDMLRALRSHRNEYGWDMADICLAQCSEVVDKLCAPAQVDFDASTVDLQQMIMNDMPLVDELFPSLWDMLGPP